MMALDNRHRRMPPAIPHYWGDATRILMLCGTGLALLGVPFASGFLHDAFPAEVVGALFMVAFAALTNPLRQWVSAGDALLSGAAGVLFEIGAYDAYEAADFSSFVVYEAVGALFILAFYFSIKTVRAFSLKQIGAVDRAEQLSARDPLEAEEAYNPDFMGD